MAPMRVIRLDIVTSGTLLLSITNAIYQKIPTTSACEYALLTP